VNNIVSADVKLIPRPPALVESRKIYDFEFSWLKVSIIFYLSITEVYPSNLSKL